ncbi:integrase [Gossypium australe]|uniref:Integrase n=1 Tax=Gossypium australe TaxID=47621 RepID=A0A5B6X1U4_9ROSI|nr:integrase [Gossypium australe]
MTQKDLNLRQRRWLELLKYYKLVIDYHPGKLNVVADALSGKSLFALRTMNTHKSVKPRNVIKNCTLKESNVNRLVIQSTKSDLMIIDFAYLKIQSLRKILYEAYSGCLSVHPGSTKMHNDLKKLHWWSGMKRDISDFVSKCLIYQQVKVEHQVPSSLL